MKRNYSSVTTKPDMPGSSPTSPDNGNGDFLHEDMGDYWATAFGNEARVHQLFVYVKVVFGDNADIAFYKHVDATMTIKDIKNMITRKNLHPSVAEHPLNMRMQISGGASMMIGADLHDVPHGDGPRTNEAKKHMGKDNQTLKDVMLAYDGARLLLGHEVVDKDVRMAVVLYWSTVC